MRDKELNIAHRDAGSVGITWIDSMILFGPDSKKERQWIGVCHYTDKVYMFSPFDYEKPIMIVTIKVDPVEKWCEKCEECVYFGCPLNRFNKEKFLLKFKGMGAESLGLPQGFGTTPLWYNDPASPFHTYWGKLLSIFKCKPAGGELVFSEERYNKVGLI